MSKKNSRDREIADLRQRVEALESPAKQEPVTINVFPGGLVTRGDVACGVAEAIEFAARDGRVVRGGQS